MVFADQVSGGVVFMGGGDRRVGGDLGGCNAVQGGQSGQETEGECFFHDD